MFLQPPNRQYDFNSIMDSNKIQQNNCADFHWQTTQAFDRNYYYYLFLFLFFIGVESSFPFSGCQTEYEGGVAQKITSSHSLL